MDLGLRDQRGIHILNNSDTVGMLMFVLLGLGISGLGGVRFGIWDFGAI